LTQIDTPKTWKGGEVRERVKEQGSGGGGRQRKNGRIV